MACFSKCLAFAVSSKSGDKSPHCYVNVKSQLSQREAFSFLC